jgi:YVTN family beta-propeller protein
VDFRILGPLVVTDRDDEVPLPGGKQRGLLAILLLHANEVVSSDALIDQLWDERPPPTAAKSLQVHMSRLRQALDHGVVDGSNGLIVTKGSGYLIRIAPEQLDATRFERLLDEGTRELARSDPERAAELLREALGLWHGPALTDFAYERFAHAEAARLEELRLAATERLIEAELALGHGAQQVGELESLVERHPLRERLRAQLMLALYRSGRQADALAAYQDTRRTLVEELGIEPGEELREMQRAILAQDPALGAPDSGARRERAGAALPGRHVASVALAAIAAILVAVLVVVVAGDGADERPAAALTGDSHAVAVIDPATNTVTAAVPVGANPGPLAFEPRSRSLWVGNLDDESVTRIDTRPVRAGQTIAIGARPDGLAAGGGAVWVGAATRVAPFVTARRIDPRFDRAAKPVRVQSLPDGSTSLAIDRESLWVAPANGLLTRLDPATGVVKRPRIDVGHAPRHVSSDGRTAWVTDASADVVTRIDVETGITKTIPLAGGPTDVALGAGATWVTLAFDDSVARLDPETGTVRDTIRVGTRPQGVAVGAGAVWVANSGAGTVSRLDPGSGRLTETLRVGASPQDVIAADGRVWVSVRPRSATGPAGRGGTLRVELPPVVDFLDPALAYLGGSWQVLNPTCAKLLNYPDASGPAGRRLVPELAESLPTVSNGGRTYTFTVRRGYRFSPPSGEPVTAQSMKYTIDRTLNPKMRSAAAGLMPDVAGVTAAGRTLTVRLTRPSSTFLSRISLPFFCAVPLGTPIDPEGLRDVPGAGPYYVSSHPSDDEIVLRRNPNYHGPRPQRPDAIRIVIGNGQAGAIRRVERGESDYAPFVGIPSEASRLEKRYGAGSPAARAGRQRYFVHPAPQLDYLVFNTSRPPFSSARLRRGVNYALDRRALARSGLFDGLPGTPTDQYLSPVVPGFRDAHIYPLTPDVAKARELAGPGRRSVVLYALGEPGHLRFAEIVKANLRQIGIDVQVKSLGDTIFSRIARRDEPFDLAVVGWQSDFPDPVDILGQVDGRTIQPEGNINYAYFNDPHFNARLDAASALPSPARELALGRLEVRLARRAAPWAAVTNGNQHDFFSARVGCQAHDSVYGMDLGSLCIRRLARQTDPE